jgi:hypothetical protein
LLPVPPLQATAYSQYNPCYPHFGPFPIYQSPPSLPFPIGCSKVNLYKSLNVWALFPNPIHHGHPPST